MVFHESSLESSELSNLIAFITSIYFIDASALDNENLFRSSLEYSEYLKAMTRDHKPFQKIVFVNNSTEKLKENCISEILSIGTHEKTILDSFTASFDDVLCVSIPISTLDTKIQTFVEPNNLVKKKILDAEVTGKEFNGYIKKYFELNDYQENFDNEVIYETTAELQLSFLADQAFEAYEKAILANKNEKIAVDLIDEINNKIKNLVILWFKSQDSLENEEIFYRVLKDLNVKIKNRGKLLKTDILREILVTKELEERKKAEQELEKKNVKWIELTEKKFEQEKSLKEKQQAIELLHLRKAYEENQQRLHEQELLLGAENKSSAHEKQKML